MNTYAKIINHTCVEYPLTEQQIKAANPHISFVQDSFSPPQGYRLVHKTKAPLVDHTKDCVEGIPVWREGEWYQQWIVTPASYEHVQSRIHDQTRHMKTKRNQLLAASDWTRMDDNHISEHMKQLWADYRQQLRDITQQSGWPWQVNWPEPPV